MSAGVLIGVRSWRLIAIVWCIFVPELIHVITNAIGYWCCFRCRSRFMKYGPGYAFAFSDFDGRRCGKGSVGDESRRMFGI